MNKNPLIGTQNYCIETKLKVYYYDLPSRYQSCSNALKLNSKTFYAANTFFKGLIRTLDPADADYFFVPLNLVVYQFKNKNPRDVLKYLKYMTDKKDHIIVASGDFSQRSKINHYGHAYQETYDWLDNFILLALESTNDLIPGQDIGIIPFNTLTDSPYFNTNNRRYLYSFIGELNHELLPESHVRHKLNLLENKEDVLVISKLKNSLRIILEQNYKTDNDYELVARNSIFTLAPAGYGKWTYRFFQAINWGSIPVMISDDYIKPFSEYIPYDLFSVTIPEEDILNVDNILRNISPKEIEFYQKNLKLYQDKFTKHAFFEMLVESLVKLRN
jgi:hypothetical protein